MENINVYSPIEDRKIRTSLTDSPMWNKAKTEEEYMENPKRYPIWYKYTFKFDGTKIVMFTKVKKIAN